MYFYYKAQNAKPFTNYYTELAALMFSLNGFITEWKRERDVFTRTGFEPTKDFSGPSTFHFDLKGILVTNL